MGAQTIVHRHRHHAGLGAGIEHERVFDAVLGKESNPVSLLDPGTSEGVGQAVNLFAGLAVGEGPTVHDGEF